MSIQIKCAICGNGCRWLPAESDMDAPAKFGGWYCDECDAYSETDVEVED